MTSTHTTHVVTATLQWSATACLSPAHARRKEIARRPGCSQPWRHGRRLRRGMDASATCVDGARASQDMGNMVSTTRLVFEGSSPKIKESTPLGRTFFDATPLGTTSTTPSMSFASRSVATSP